VPPDLPGVISAEEVLQTAEAIAAWQLDDGMIPWFPDGHADPWNHVEAAMALDVAGLHDAAARGYEWLRNRQRPDGAWHQYYVAGGVSQKKFDANCVAYVATGIWHHLKATADLTFAAEMWPVVDRAIDWVLELQRPRGEIRWARHPDGTPWSFALLTGSASIHHSIRCALALAERLGHERPDWELAAARLAHVIRSDPDAFAPKERWAMDWYYPVLCGVIIGDEGRERLAGRYDEFVMAGKGVRCVADRTWVTTAETAECTMAHAAVGSHHRSLDLLSLTRSMRTEDGHYWTGVVHPQGVRFPADERTTYSGAAVILAADALTRSSSTSGVLVDHAALPSLLSVDEDQPTATRRSPNPR
jgi:hypothetical protein